MTLILDTDFYKEETRCGFLVTAQRKRIWAIELELLSVFDEICRKHNLRYFVTYGTLLGAVRHKGFIPWDDDLDVAMLRPDYERLKLVIQDELKEPYFFQDAYTDSILSTFSKIRHSHTTAIEKKYCQDAAPHQGIFIDIFPLDGGYPLETSNIELIGKEIWTSVINPELIKKIIHTPEYPAALPRDILQELISMPPRNRLRHFEDFLIDHFNGASQIGLFLTMIYVQKRLQKSWYDEIVYLPFEHMMVPVPSRFDEVLTYFYGDYHQIRQGTTYHPDIIMDPDRSYVEYYKEMGIL